MPEAELPTLPLEPPAAGVPAELCAFEPAALGVAATLPAAVATAPVDSAVGAVAA